MEQIYKYPRTRHLEGSREQLGDEDLKCVRLDEIRGKYLVLEEKVDGANCGISFGGDGKIYEAVKNLVSMNQKFFLI